MNQLKANFIALSIACSMQSCGLVKPQSGGETQSAFNSKRFLQSDEVKGCSTFRAGVGNAMSSPSSDFSEQVFIDKCQRVYKNFEHVLTESGEKIPGIEVGYKRFCAAFDLFLESAGRKQKWMTKFDSKQANFALKCPEGYFSAESEKVISISGKIPEVSNSIQKPGKIATNGSTEGPPPETANTWQTPLKNDPKEESIQ